MENQDIVRNTYVRWGIISLLGLASLFLLVQTIGSVKAWNRGTLAERPQITVTGSGEAFVVPTIATFSLSVQESGKTVKEAQDKATTKTNKVVAYLEQAGIEKKDVQTQGYNINPKYEYPQARCTATYCPPVGSPTIVGYEVSQSIQVKVRDTAKAGDVLTGIGSLEVQNLSGLQLTVDDDDAVLAEARAKAIADAKTKAEALARDLGVSLGNILSFNESNNPYYPMYAKLEMDARGGVANQVAPAPALPVGENKVTSSVTITYEIR